MEVLRGAPGWVSVTAAVPDSQRQATLNGLDSDLIIQVGILTKGKPTLGMVLTSLLLQEAVKVRIHVVDTSLRPVINRDDVRFALGLAGDRGIQCSYDFAGESERAFSTGRSRLIQELDGPYLCLMDDDVVMPSLALSRLLEAANRAGVYGYISPLCMNAPRVGSDEGSGPACTPGSLIYQDALVHQILLDYYATTTDVLDRHETEEKVWEPAFLTALFETLQRSRVRQDDTIVYHLDYHEVPRWIEEEQTVLARSAKVARQLTQRARDDVSRPRQPPGRVIYSAMSAARGNNWLGRARRLLRTWI